ncbi:polymorphic toxin-type HINT domain-containing protein [Kitasatospora sp. NPDC048540]|uniref:polymorphic toxin-type HINT domain-containing protein n=1 Tax=Kitasatospora sp. NPDC048540 TaxID=3155634 RepID=UPI003400D75E
MSAAALAGSLLVPTAAAAAGPDYSRIWSPPNTALGKTASVNGQKAPAVPVGKPTHEVPPAWTPPKDTKSAAVPRGRAGVVLGSASAGTPAKALGLQAPAAGAPASGAAEGAGTLPVSLAPLPGAGDTPGQTVQVEVADEKKTAAAGVPGLAVALSREGASSARPVRVAIDTSTLDDHQGADWAARAQLVTLPACSLTTPEVKGCLERTPVASHYDPASKRLIADVTLPGSDSAPRTSIQSLSAEAPAAAGAGGGAMVLAAVSGSSGGAGTYAATPLNPSQAWTAGGASGAFDYSYPIQAPPSLGGEAPTVSLSYDSASVDGKTSSTNAQASWIGDGWDYSAGFVERSYKPCSKAGITGSGDLCWGGANATLSLGSHSGELVPDDASCQTNAPGTTEQSNCTWRLKGDDGTKVQFLTGATNGTWNGSYIKATDTDGTVYYFGLNHLPKTDGTPSTVGPDSGSAWTVPVYSPNTGDPCYDAAKGKASWCQAAWRWNLDYVVDPHGNLTTYTYTPEANWYAMGGGQNHGTGEQHSYTRGGVLKTIAYGQLLSDQITANGTWNSAALIDFTSGERCVTSPAACDPAQRTAAHADDWPDVPLDQNCAQSGTCTNYGPTFWTTKWLTAVTTRVRANGAWQDVDLYELGHRFVNVQNTTENTQVPWLGSITHTGKDTQASATPVALPPVTFTEMLLPNRVDGTNLVPSRPAYSRPRIQLITTEAGATIGVDYKSADCSRDRADMPASADSDTRSCYNVKWHPSNEQPNADPIDDWFQRYPAATVTVNPNTPGSVPMTTAYTYGKAAWHRNDSPFTENRDRTWDQFRGYATVTTVSGSGQDGPKAQSASTFHQGMDGDTTSSGTRSVQISGPMSGQVTDADWLSGQILETDTYTQAGGTIAAYTVATSTSTTLTATHSQPGLPALVARYAPSTAISLSKALTADGTWRSMSKTTTRDPVHANRVLSTLETADGLPDTCVRQGYASGRDPQVSTLVAETVNVSGPGACTVTPTAANLISWSRQYYDGQPLWLAADKAEPTSTEIVDHFAGATAAFVPKGSQSFDVYGRVLTSTDATSTDSAHSAGATTTVAYQPAKPGELPGTLTVTTPAPAAAADVATGRVTTAVFNSARSLPKTVTDYNGRTTSESYDALGRLTGVWVPGRDTGKSANKAFTYAVPGVVNNAAIPPTTTTTSLVSTPDAGGNYATLQAVQIMDGLGRTIQTQSAPATSAYQPGRIITDTAYDSQGRVTRSNAPWFNNAAGPATTLFQTTTNQVPAQTHTVYDGLGRPVTGEFVAYGVVQTTTATAYPGVDRTDVTPPSGAMPGSSVTDARGRTTQLWQYKTATATGRSADADVTSYAYTPSGQTASRTDAAGNTWTYGYDLRGRQTTATDPDTGTSTTSYDTAGRPVTTTDARGQSMTRTYDLLGRTTGTYTGTAADPAKQLTATTYDTVVKGQPSTSTRYVGGAGGTAYTSTVLAYDTSYHATKTTTTIPGTEVGSSNPFTYTYQAVYDQNTGLLTKDNRSAIGDIAAETVTYAYEKYGTLQGFSALGGSTYSLSNDYDAFGRPTRSTVNPWGTQIVVTNSYDDSTGRQLSQYVDKQTAATGAVQQTTYAYDPSGRLTAIRDIPDNTPASTDLQCFGYDYLGRLTDTWSDTGTLTLAAQPTVGNRGTCTNTSPTSGAQAPKKTTVGGPAPYWQTYTYDLTGNRTSRVQHDTGGDTAKDTTTTQTFPTAGSKNTPTNAPNSGGGTGGPHALTGSTTTGPAGSLGATAQYDAMGNTTAVTDTSGTATLTWDGEDKLASYTKTGSPGTTTYLYDADGNQLIRRNPGKTTINLGGDELTYDTSTKALTGTRSYQIPAGLTLVRQGGKSTYQVNDHHGTGNLSLDATTLTETRRPTDPFGNPRGTQPAPGTWAGDKGFVGGTKDDTTGLTNLGARQYQPTTGRFLNPDPLLVETDPQQWNGYAYSNNNPVNLSDPSGLRPDGTCGGIGQCQTPEGQLVTETWTLTDHGDWSVQISKSKKSVLPGGVQISTTSDFKKLQEKTNNNLKIYQKQHYSFGEDSTEDYHQYVAAAVNACFEISECKKSSTYDELWAKLRDWQLENIPMIGAGDVAFASSVVGRGLARAGKLEPRSELKSSSPCDSFPAGTEVLEADGSTKPIEQVKVGDSVTATDPSTGVSEPRTVDATIATPDDTDFTVIAVDGASTRLTATDHHPLWSPSSNRWLNANELQPGTTLLSTDGREVRIAAVSHLTKTQTAYNLTVRDVHTYYVLAGTTPILVHNSGICGKTALENGDWQHILDRHRPGGAMTDDASGIFTGKEKVVRQRIADTINRGTPKPNTPDPVTGAARPGQIYEWDFGTTVGKAGPANGGGDLTSIRVIVNDGKVVTAFPY